MYYTLGFSQRFDVFHRNAYEASGDGQCGTPYQKSGLVVSFSQTDLQRIPYNLLIEVPITVTQGQLCSKYNSIEVQIIATCEIPTSESQVFQYGIVNGAISYDDADKIYALNDTATFSVSWPEISTQRRTEEALGLHLIGNQSINLSKVIESLNVKHDSLATSLKEDHLSLATSLKEDHRSLATSLKESLTASLKEDHHSLASSLKESLTNSLKDDHHKLTTEINAKLETMMHVAAVVLSFFGFLLIVIVYLIYQNQINQKRINTRNDEFPAFRMP